MNGTILLTFDGNFQTAARINTILATEGINFDTCSKKSFGGTTQVYVEHLSFKQAVEISNQLGRDLPLDCAVIGY